MSDYRRYEHSPPRTEYDRHLPPEPRLAEHDRYEEPWQETDYRREEVHSMYDDHAARRRLPDPDSRYGYENLYTR